MSNKSELSKEAEWAYERAEKVLDAWRLREDDKVKLALPVKDPIAIQEIAAAILEGVRTGLDRGEAIARDASAGDVEPPAEVIEMINASPKVAMAGLVKLGGEIGNYIAQYKV